MRTLVGLLIALLILAGGGALVTVHEAAARPAPTKPTEPVPERPLDQDEVMAICTAALVAAMSGDPDPLAPLLKTLPEHQVGIVGMICVAFLNGAYIHRQLTTQPAPAPVPEDAVPLAGGWTI